MRGTGTIAMWVTATTLGCAAAAGMAQQQPSEERIVEHATVTVVETDAARLTVSMIPVHDPKSSGGDRLVGGGGGGGCPLVTVQHTEDQFFDEGATVALQQGIVTGESAGASYTLPADQFPLQFSSAEILWGQSHGNPTVTEWAVTVWQGLPGTGTPLFTESTIGGVLPPIQLPAHGGARFVIVRVEVDPTDPDQINITGDANNTFSVTWEIVEHNSPTGFPCLIPPNANQNAFPATDSAQPDSPDVPAGNWLFAVNCGLSCPGGWDSFANCPSLLPGGDWVIRATYTPLNCAGTGACCFTDGSCTINFSGACISQGGVFQGADTECDPNPCPQPPGACCLSDDCQVIDQTVCENMGGTFIGGVCATDTCLGACCIDDSGTGQCFTLFSQLECDIIGAEFLGPQTDCTGVICFGTGACCIDGACFDDFDEDDCITSGGEYQGDLTTCAMITCPIPTGACCFAGGLVCNQQTQAACESIATNVWLGAGTTCEPGACDADEPCPWDCAPENGNGVVNIDDLLGTINGFGGGSGPCDNSPDNGDGTFGNGIVNIDDLLGVINNFGDCP